MFLTFTLTEADTVESLLRQAIARGHDITPWSMGVVGRLSDADRPIGTFRLREVTGLDLGFTEDQHWVRSRDLYNRALQEGLYLCPAFAPLKLLAENATESFSGMVAFGMESLPDDSKNRDKCVFAIGRGKYGTWLHLRYCARSEGVDTDNMFRVWDRWMFACE